MTAQINAEGRVRAMPYRFRLLRREERADSECAVLLLLRLAASVPSERTSKCFELHSRGVWRLLPHLWHRRACGRAGEN